MKLIQFADVLDYGDGIANDIWGKHEIFRALGYESVVCALIVDERLKNQARLFHEVTIEKEDILIHHYSGFSRAIDKMWAAKCTKVMVYHNITPPEFVDGPTKVHCQEGLDQLKTLGNCYQYFVGDSQFNVDCLAELGVTCEGDVLPIMVEFPEKKVVRRKKDVSEEKIFLFVGRIAQNKKVENVIRVFDYYYTHINDNCRLCIPGNMKVSEEYTRDLNALIESLVSGEYIDLLGKVSDEELEKMFQEADVYVSMSEHEGFGIPLLEAMNHCIPVVAYDTTAVGETMGNSGVLMKVNDPSIVASVIHQVFLNPELQKVITDAQIDNLKRFKKAAVMEKISELLQKWQS